MQTIWTRVAQVRISCHCPQCLPSASAVARRAATTATRRGPRFWTSSTVWYSGIFAVAATLDLGVKQQRRDQWNKAIADVKHDLRRSSEADANREFLDELEQENVASDEMRENLDSGPLRPYVPEWPASTGQERMTNKLPPQSIYTNNEKKAKHMLDRWYPKKMERVQLSVDALQLEFFLELHRRGWHEEAARAVPACYAEHILQPVQNIEKTAAVKHKDLHAILQLKGKFSYGGEDEEAGRAAFATWQRSEGDMPLCSYNQDELGHFHNTAHDLNATLRKLFDMGRDRVLTAPAVLAKVYYNLSVSSAPPNIDTYNTLIVGLCDIGTRRLVEDCINSLQCAKIRHNEVSLASILNYWTLTGNEDQFHYWVQLMRGDWRGLARAQPGAKITESSQGRLIRGSAARIIQLASPAPMVFGALIKGVIKFSGIDAALGVCDAAREEGWGLCISGLHPLLKDCSKRRDWDTGLATWNQIQALRRTPPKRFESSMLKPRGWKPPTIDLPTFASMLQLCSRCNHRPAFQDTMEQAIMAHPGSANDLIRMVRAERLTLKTVDAESNSSKLTQLSDVADWLQKQGIHQDTDKLKSMQWQDIVRLDATDLKAKGVTSAKARERLLKIFQQVREAHPVRYGTKTPWLFIEDGLRFRALVLMRRKDAQKGKAQVADGHGLWHRNRTQLDDSHEQDISRPDRFESRQAPHRGSGMEIQALDVADGRGEQSSYAIGMASIPDDMHSSIQNYQPIGQ